MSEAPSTDDLLAGIEMNLMTQEQVVSEFRGLVKDDIAAAAERYIEFVEKLDQSASRGDVQVRSLVGGPDSLYRARLIDIMAGSYETASNDVKEKIRDQAMQPLLRDNFFYVRLAVVNISNPYLVGDIIREWPLANPGADFYEADLQESGAIEDPQQLQSWFDASRQNMFAAMAIALQRDHWENVSRIMRFNDEPIFKGAAHVVAANHDLFAERKVMADPMKSKPELLERYRSDFVPDFAEMIEQEAATANWLPLDGKVYGES